MTVKKKYHSLPPKPKYHLGIPYTKYGVSKPIVITIITLVSLALLSTFIFFGKDFVGMAYQFAQGDSGNQVGMFYENGEVVIKGNLINDINITGAYLDLRDESIPLCSVLISTYNNLWGEFYQSSCDSNTIKFADSTLGQMEIRNIEELFGFWNNGYQNIKVFVSPSMYNNVDLKFNGNGQNLPYEFRSHPGILFSQKMNVHPSEEFTSSEANYNFVTIGNPCENGASAHIMGNPNNCSTDLQQGQGRIKLYNHNGKVYLLIDGYSLAEEMLALDIFLAMGNSFSTNQFSSAEVRITGTNIDNAIISPYFGKGEFILARLKLDTTQLTDLNFTLVGDLYDQNGKDLLTKSEYKFDLALNGTQLPPDPRQECINSGKVWVGGECKPCGAYPNVITHQLDNYNCPTGLTCVNSTCQRVCTLQTLEWCNETDCISLGGMWNLVSNSCDTICDTNHLNFCLDLDNCRNVGGVWFNTTLGADEEMISYFECLSCDANHTCATGQVCENGRCKAQPVVITGGEIPAAPSGGGGGRCRPEPTNCSVWSYCNESFRQQRTCYDFKCRTGKIIEVQNCTPCPESWVCSIWSECYNGVQQRTCTDWHNCGTTFKKPILVKNCEEQPLGPEPYQISYEVAPPYVPKPQPQVPQPTFWDKYGTYLISGIVGLAFIIGLAVLLTHLIRPHKKAYNIDELKGWIQKEKEMGTNEEDIKQILIQETGWSKEEIDSALKEIDNPQKPAEQSS